MRNTKRKSNCSACSDLFPSVPYMMLSIHCSLKTGNVWMEILTMKLQPQPISKAEWPSHTGTKPQRPLYWSKHALTQVLLPPTSPGKVLGIFKTSLRRFLLSWALGIPGSETNALLQNGSTFTDYHWWQPVMTGRIRLVQVECLEEANQNAPRFLWQLLLSSLHTAGCPSSSSPPPRLVFSRTADHVKHNEGDRKETTYFSQLY